MGQSSISSLWQADDNIGGAGSSARRRIHAVVANGGPSALLRATAERLGSELRCHGVKGRIEIDDRSLSGTVMIIEAGADDAAAQLRVAELRPRIEAGIVFIGEGLSAETRLLARLHGADHVVEAGVDERELAAIIRNEMRHRARSQNRPRNGEENHYWRLDAERWSLVAPNDREIRLTRSEYGVLAVLLGEPGMVQPREALRAAVSGDIRCQRVLDVVLSRLRRKVWDCAGLELPLRAARNEGYVFAGAVRPVESRPGRVAARGGSRSPALAIA
jgi:two-component system OmpR family response regulator